MLRICCGTLPGIEAPSGQWRPHASSPKVLLGGSTWPFNATFAGDAFEHRKFMNFFFVGLSERAGWQPYGAPETSDNRSSRKYRSAEGKKNPRFNSSGRLVRKLPQFHSGRPDQSGRERAMKRAVCVASLRFAGEYQYSSTGSEHEVLSSPYALCSR